MIEPVTVKIENYENEWPIEVQVKTEHNASDQESEAGSGVNYHVQYVEPQDVYTQPHQTHMETLRSYPLYNVGSVEGAGNGDQGDSDWGGVELAGYGVVLGSGGPGSTGGTPGTDGTGGTEPEEGGPGSPDTPAAALTQPRMAPATVQWLLDNYETAEGVSLPRSTLYSHYLRHCTSHRLDPVNAASFGKLIRSVFVGLRTRRLGTRGNSKYHYYGIRAKSTASDSPSRTIEPSTLEDKQDDSIQDRDRDMSEATVGAGGPHRQYLGSVFAPDPPVFEETPADCTEAELNALHAHHKQHGVEFLEAVAALDTNAVERARRSFWRKPPPELCRKSLYKLMNKKEIVAWLKQAELALYQKAVELLLPDVLRPIPPQLTQAIRNFAKSVEGALSSGSCMAPASAGRVQAGTAAALCGALRRYTSLNHLAQAARAVLHNHHQIQQMLADLNRVDFRVVREQAAWACACSNPRTAVALEHDFKATLGRGATLEQWASWLEACVNRSLSPHERRSDYCSRARRFLLDWSFYSSLVIRELTLRSAASFGSFHLIRLLYDEYVAYLIERRVAQHEKAPPIAIMHPPMDDDDDIADENRTEPDEDEADLDWEDEDDDDQVDGKKTKLN